MRRRCTFEKHGGYPCNLDWPASKAAPGTPQWEAVIRRDMCEPCGAEVKRRHEKEGRNSGAWVATILLYPARHRRRRMT